MNWDVNDECDANDSSRNDSLHADVVHRACVKIMILL